MQQNRILLVIKTVMLDAGPRRSGLGPFDIIKGMICAGRRLRCGTNSQESKAGWAGGRGNEWLLFLYGTGYLSAKFYVLCKVGRSKGDDAIRVV